MEKRLGNNKRSKYVAAVLALFLGGIGAHKFYMGNTLLGLLYLFFAWTLIPLIASIIEFIMFLYMSQDYFPAICDKKKMDIKLFEGTLGDLFIILSIIIIMILILGQINLKRIEEQKQEEEKKRQVLAQIENLKKESYLKREKQFMIHNIEKNYSKANFSKIVMDIKKLSQSEIFQLPKKIQLYIANSLVKEAYKENKNKNFDLGLERASTAILIYNNIKKDNSPGKIIYNILSKNKKEVDKVNAEAQQKRSRCIRKMDEKYPIQITNWSWRVRDPIFSNKRKYILNIEGYLTSKLSYATTTPIYVSIAVFDHKERTRYYETETFTVVPPNSKGNNFGGIWKDILGDKDLLYGARIEEVYSYQRGIKINYNFSDRVNVYTECN